MNRLCICLATILFAASSVFAGGEPVKVKEVVVSATKIEEAVDETTSSVTVITGDTIKKMKVEFVPDVLKKMPELNVTQNGGIGKQATVFLRGGSASQTLVMIDGVKVKSTTLGTFDFSGITSGDIERIEIVKGPQSTIYGSEAMAGVINIITKKGKGKPGIKATFEGGSFSTYNPSATVSGEMNNIDFRLTGTYLETDGISVVKNGTERDGYKNASFSGKVGARPTEKFEAELSGRIYYDRSDLDVSGVDDLNFRAYGHHYIISGKGKIYLSDRWEQIISGSRVYDSIENRDPDTAGNNSDIITSIDTYDWQHNIYPVDEYTLTLGVEYRKENGENKGMFDKDLENKALYVNNKLKFFDDDLILNAGFRYDDHQSFGEETTYRAGAVYFITPVELTVRGSYGTGFRAPTLNELFYNGPYGSIGNPNLQPERSNSWEIGIEKDLVKDRILLAVTYFEQKYKNLINWVETPPGSWVWMPQNVAKAQVRGIEARAVIQIIDDLKVTTAYTNLDSEDKDTGKRLTRRPIDKFNFTVDYSNGPVSLLASYVYVGKVFDSDFVGNLHAYSVVDVSGGYRVNDNLRIFGRVDNVFNENYETTGRFSTPGLTAYAGVELAI